MKEQAKIFDYARLCKKHEDCRFCPISVDVNGMDCGCVDLIQDYPQKANEIILNWCKEHPVETRQSKLLKCYPYISIIDKTVDICPKKFDSRFLINGKCEKQINCSSCKENYWLAEVDE